MDIVMGIYFDTWAEIEIREKNGEELQQLLTEYDFTLASYEIATSAFHSKLRSDRDFAERYQTIKKEQLEKSD